MFTGIIEAKAKVLSVQSGDQTLQIVVARPTDFDDIKLGDSVACNGVCLTVESFDDQSLTFTLGGETLAKTGWTVLFFENALLNLERSLKFGDRIHGHLVSGHVDVATPVIKKQWQGECLFLEFSLPVKHAKEIWEKSSVVINGVSLTVNGLTAHSFDVCLIPETLRKTNLENLQVDQLVNLETDYYMKGLLRSQGESHA